MTPRDARLGKLEQSQAFSGKRHRRMNIVDHLIGALRVSPHHDLHHGMTVVGNNCTASALVGTR